MATAALLIFITSYCFPEVGSHPETRRAQPVSDPDGQYGAGGKKGGNLAYDRRETLLEAAEQEFSGLMKVLVRLTDPEPHVANGLAAEALFEFTQNVELRDLLQLIVQGRLKNAHIEDALAQRDRSRVRGNKIAHDFRPRFDHFGFLQTLAQTKAMHQFRQ